LGECDRCSVNPNNDRSIYNMDNIGFILKPAGLATVRCCLIIPTVFSDVLKYDRIPGQLSGKSWRARRSGTGLACLAHSGEQLGPVADLGLRIGDGDSLTVTAIMHRQGILTHWLQWVFGQGHFSSPPFAPKTLHYCSDSEQRERTIT